MNVQTDIAFDWNKLAYGSIFCLTIKMVHSQFLNRKICSSDTPPPPPPQRSASEQLGSDVLQQRMAQNQQQRDQLQSTVGQADPERAQYLEDERLAICLQNEEFLRELRDDEDFIKTLERGV